jgi:hypothetical protein
MNADPFGKNITFFRTCFHVRSTVSIHLENFRCPNFRFTEVHSLNIRRQVWRKSPVSGNPWIFPVNLQYTTYWKFPILSGKRWSLMLHMFQNHLAVFLFHNSVEDLCEVHFEMMTSLHTILSRLEQLSIWREKPSLIVWNQIAYTKLDSSLFDRTHCDLHVLDAASCAFESCIVCRGLIKASATYYKECEQSSYGVRSLERVCVSHFTEPNLHFSLIFISVLYYSILWMLKLYAWKTRNTPSKGDTHSLTDESKFIRGWLCLHRCITQYSNKNYESLNWIKSMNYCNDFLTFFL